MKSCVWSPFISFHSSEFLHSLRLSLVEYFWQLFAVGAAQTDLRRQTQLIVHYTDVCRGGSLAAAHSSPLNAELCYFRPY